MRQQYLASFIPTLALAASSQLYASHYSGTVNLLTLDGSSLKLTSSLRGCGSLPSWLTWDSATRMLYCSDEQMSGQGSISQFSAAADGSLTAGPKASATLGGVANALYGGANGDGFVAIAHYQASAISTFQLPITTSSKALQTFTYKLNGRGTNPSRQDAPHPHGITVEPNGNWLVAPDLGADLLRLYSIDKTSGKLTECTPFIVPGGTGPRHAAFYVPGTSSRVMARQAAAGTMMYTANELGNSVSAYTVSSSGAGCPTLKLVQTLTPYAGNKAAPRGTKVAEVRVKGNFLYSAQRNDKSFSPNDSMTYFKIGSDGQLTYGASSSSYGTYPRTFSINKDGTMVAIGDQTTANVAIVSRDATTGALGSQIATLRVASAGTPENEDGLSSVVWAD